MALWQYTFFVLPKVSVDALASDYHFNRSEEGFNDELYWRFDPVNRDFFNGMNEILTKNKSWSQQIDLYGNQESNCFEVLFENNIVLSVSFRIDYTSNYEPILNQIIEYCLHRGLIILDEHLNLLPFNLETFAGIIYKSPQVKMYKKLSKGP